MTKYCRHSHKKSLCINSKRRKLGTHWVVPGVAVARPSCHFRNGCHCVPCFGAFISLMYEGFFSSTVTKG